MMSDFSDTGEAQNVRHTELLKNWLEKSLKNAFEYLQEKTPEIEQELPTLLNLLDSLQSFQDVSLLKNSSDSSSKKLFRWCEGQHLDSILNQDDFLVSSVGIHTIWIEQFRKSCINKIHSLRNMDNDFISTLNDFLNLVNSKPERQQILDHEVVKKYLQNDSNNGQECMKSLVENCDKFVKETTTNDEFFKTAKRFREFAKPLIITEDKWTTKLQLQVRIICKRHLLPLVEVIEKVEDGRKIVSVKGTVIVINKIKSRIEEFISNTEEVNIVGFVSVHIDCDLENEIWHGTSLTIVTDKLFVDDNKTILWDVSGRYDGFGKRLEKAKDGQLPGDDGLAGEHGQPGESGGNVLIKCNEIFNAEKWTIVSNGGRGKDGQTGGDGKDGQDGQNGTMTKPTKVEFDKIFSPLLKWWTSVRYPLPLKKIFKDLQVETKMRYNTTNAKLITDDSNDDKYFSAKISIKDRIVISILFHKKRILKKNFRMILWKGEKGERGKMGGRGGEGGRGGRGGYSGTINIQSGNQELALQTDNIESKVLKTVKTKSDDGDPGSDGEDGFNGKSGKWGKSTGDVGFIDNLNDNRLFGWKKDKTYHLGFEEDEQLEIDYISKDESNNCKHPYTSCKVDKEKRFAVLETKEDVRDLKTQTVDKTTHGRQCQALQVPLTKKFTNQESLVQHLAQITQRKSISQHCTFDNIDEIVKQTMENYQALLHFSSRYQRCQAMNDRKNNPEAIYQRSIGSRYILLDGDDGNNEQFDDWNTFNQPSITEKDMESLVKTMETLDKKTTPSEISNVNEYLEDYLQQNYHYLEPKKAKDDANNILHAAFGQKDEASGLYVCSNVDYRRKQIILASSTEQPEDVRNDPSASIIGLFSEEVSSLQNVDDNTNDVDHNILPEKLGLDELRLILGREDYLIISHDNCGRQTKIGQFEAPTFKCDGQYNFINKSKKNIILLSKDCQGVWQRLDCKSQLFKYFERRIQQIVKFADVSIDENGSISLPKPRLAPTSSDFEAYKDLLKWLNDKTTEANQSIVNQIITSVTMLNPEYGCTPGELSKLLLIRLKKTELNNQLVEDVGLLADRVIDYDSRNVDPIFYLTIVRNLIPFRWKYEFILLEIEDQMKFIFQNEKRASWRKMLYKLDDKILAIFREGLRAAGQLRNRKIRPEILKQTLEIMANQKIWIKEDVISLCRLSLNDWFYDLKGKIWLKEITKLNGNMTLEEEKEAVYLLLELENKKGRTFYQNVINKSSLVTAKELINQLKKHLYYDDDITTSENQSAPKERNHNKIISMIEREKSGNTSHFIVSIHKKFKIEERLSIVKKKVKKKVNVTEESGFVPDANQIQIENFLCNYFLAVYETLKIELRDTQLVAIYTLLMKENNTLVQVPTGEGKSLIVAALAIYHALNFDKKVDVITSNNVLAMRDSCLSKDNGGLKELYQNLQVKVAHNCSEDKTSRSQAYKSAVVYGELSNFQRDYLLDEFYTGYKIRGDRPFDLVIVDEVDCMLLDRGNNMLYLSHDIPGIEMLESLYVFVWEKICSEFALNARLNAIKSDNFKVQTTPSILAAIKSSVQFDLYGAITIKDLELIHASLKENVDTKLSLWNHLIEREIIDKQGRLQINNCDSLKEELFNFQVKPELNPKLVYFFRKVLERKRHIRIPQHLLTFVDRNLDTILDNAVKALKLKADEHYVVDHNRAGNSKDRYPQVIIIDRDTGTDQTTSQWDGGLHQFLQLKEGCRLTLQSLKAVFVSNLSFINRYKNLTGLTGTLGSQPEREFLKEMYRCDFFSVPNAFPKRFTIEPVIVVDLEEKWLDAVKEETKRIVNEQRSTIIFCRTIKLAKVVYELLKPIYKENIHCYKRDYEHFSLGPNNMLGIGQVIVTTNLAGRGSDIKISPELRLNGGLHICLTYLPENVRVEEQAIGRAGRQGDKGSSRLILYEPDVPVKEECKWLKGNIFDMKEKRNRIELLRISRLWDDYTCRVKKQETCFDLFKEHYKKLNSEKSETTKIIKFNLLDQWALWVDKINYDLTFKFQPNEILLEQLKSEIIDTIPKTLNDEIKWMTPTRSIVLAQTLASNKNPDLKKAAEILDKLIQSNDSELYPAAHYYRAFVYMKENMNENKNNYIRTLRATETILKRNIDKHINFSRIISRLQTEGNQKSRILDAYYIQKANTVDFLSYYINSIHSLLGSRCSVSDFQKTVVDIKSAGTYFDKLVEAKCIVKCQVYKPDSVPDRRKNLEKIAKDYIVKIKHLEAFLQEVNNTSEEEIIQKLENTEMIHCTRRKFWDRLVQRGILLIPTSDQLINVNIEDPILKCVLFEPTSDHIQDLIDGKKSLTDFECAILQPGIDLEKVDLTEFGKMTSKDDLTAADITNENERDKVWEALIEQEILTSDGSLSPAYKLGISFSYPDRPLYEDAVMSLVEKIYVAELVRRQWLSERDPIFRIKLLDYIPLDPYQDMLFDLQAAHIISGHRVTEDKDVDFGEIVKNITLCSEEQDRIFQVLNNHRAQLVVWETPKASLEPIRSTIKKSENDNIREAITNEFYTFKLASFIHVIETSEKKWTKKKVLRYFGIVAIGIASIGISVALTSIPGLSGLISEIVNTIAIDIFKKGMKDTELVISALRSGKNLTWTDYHRQMFKDLKICNEKWRMNTVSLIYRFIKNKNNTTSNRESTQNAIYKEIADEPYYSRVSLSMELERLIAQIQYQVNGKLNVLCSRLGIDLKQKIQCAVQSNIKVDLLNQLYRSKDPIEAEWVVKDLLEQINYNWVNHIQSWLTTITKKVPSIQIDESKDHQTSSLANELFNNIKKVLDQHKVINNLGEMVKGLIEKFNEEIENNVRNSCTLDVKTHMDSTESKFNKETVGYVTNKLIDETEKTMASLKKSFSKTTAEAVSNYGNIWLQQVEIEQLKQWSQRTNQIGDRQRQSSLHIVACLKLIMETKDSKLLVALIREKKVPDEDPFIEAGLKNALPLIQEKYHNLTLPSLKSSKEAATLIEEDPNIARQIRLGWSRYTKQKCPFELFPIDGLGCADVNCSLRGLSDYIGYRKYVTKAFHENDKDLFDTTGETCLNWKGNKDTIMFIIETLVLPITTRLTNGSERRRTLTAAAENHLNIFCQKQIIGQEQANECKRMLGL